MTVFGAGWSFTTRTLVSATLPVLVTVPVKARVPPGGTGQGGHCLVTAITGQFEQVTVTVWLHVTILVLQALVAIQVRVSNWMQEPRLLLTVPRIETGRVAPLHGSEACGKTNAQFVSQMTVLLVPQRNTARPVATTETTWLQMVLLQIGRASCR